MKFLGLCPQVSTHVTLYDLLTRLVSYTARQLKQGLFAASLIDIPLTDLLEICYRIAYCFESLFFIPISKKVDGLDSRASFVWNDRFDGLWPVIYLLNREYCVIASSI